MVRRLVLVACILLVALWLLRAPAGDAGAPARRAQDARATEGSVQPSGRLSGAATEARSDATARSAVDDAPFASVSPKFAAQAGADVVGGLEVLAVDAVTGLPIEGAQIVVRENDHKLPFQDPGAATRRGELESTFSGAKVVYTTDAAGRTFILEPGQDGVLFARTADGRFGVATAPGRTERRDGASIELRRDFELHVRVVDPRGAPRAGVGVLLRRDARVALNDYVVGTSNDEGLAVLRHVGAALARGGATWRVELAIVTPSPIGFDVDPQDPPSTERTLVAPDTGEVELRFVDELGAPIDGPFDALLSPATTPEARGVLGALPANGGLRVENVRGRARFPHVAPGQRLRVYVAFQPGDVQSSEIEGPRAAGERVAVDVRVTGLHTLSGRLVDANDLPWSNGRVRAEVAITDFPKTWHRELHASSDAEGRFALTFLVEPAVTGVGALKLQLFDRQDVVIAGGSTAFDASNLRQDLGALCLRPTQLIAAGRVLDSNGVPVVAARVSSSAPETFGAEERSTSTDGSGRFDLRGDWENDAVLLRVTWRNRSCAEQVATGASDVELRLPPRGELRGRLLHDDRTRAMNLAVLARPVGACLGATELRAIADRAGWFSFLGLRPCEYELVLFDASLEADVASIAHVTVDSSGAVRAPALDALDAIDAAKLVRPVRIDFAGDVERLESATLLVWVDSTPGDARRLPWPGDNLLLLPTLERKIHLELRMLGRLTQRIVAPRVDSVVNLESGPRVRLLLAADAPVAPPTYSFSAQLVSAIDGEPASELLPLTYNASWSATTSELGPVHVAVYLERRLPNRMHRRQLPRSAWTLIALRAGDEPTLEMSFPQSAVDQAREAIEANDR